MSVLNFSDGVHVDTSGELRPLYLPDGWYVVGKGMLMPVDDYNKAVELIKDLKKRKVKIV